MTEQDYNEKVKAINEFQKEELLKLTDEVTAYEDEHLTDLCPNV